MKSSDNQLQRASYSVQKGRHLSKPFVVCAIEQAEGYIKKNFKTPESSFIQIYSDNTNMFDANTTLLRARIQSRHCNSKKYFTYITYDKTKRDHTAIKDTICSCNTGKRTIGTCGHATSVIYYLSHARYTKTKKSTVNIDSIINMIQVVMKVISTKMPGILIAVTLISTVTIRLLMTMTMAVGRNT
jgi:hypothetical protein